MTEQYAELRGRLVVGRKSDGRSVYDEAAKKELIVACLKQGVSVARMAMEHGINANLLRTSTAASPPQAWWRTRWSATSWTMCRIIVWRASTRVRVCSRRVRRWRVGPAKAVRH